MVQSHSQNHSRPNSASAMQNTNFSNGMAQPQPQQPQPSAMAPQFSPVQRQQTPQSMSSPMVGNTAASFSMGGVPMSASSSGHASGFPARPPSSAQHIVHTSAGRHMANQPGQQVPSRNGTPQMVTSTPNMAQSVPVTRHLTPQPMMGHSSPVAPAQGTPNVMSTPQMHRGQQITPEYMRYYAARQAMSRGSPMQHISPDQVQQYQLMLARQAQAAGQQQSVGNGGQTPQPNISSAQQYNQHMSRHMQNQIASLQSGMNTNANGINVNVNASPMANGMPASMQGMDPATFQRAQQVQRLRQQQVLQAQKSFLEQLAAQHGGQIPPQLLPQLTAQAANKAQAFVNAQYQAQAQSRVAHARAQAQAQAQAQAHAHAQAQAQAQAQGQGQGGGQGQAGMDFAAQQYMQNIQRMNMAQRQHQQQQQQQQQQMAQMAQMGRGQGMNGMMGGMQVPGGGMAGMPGGQGRGMG